jgi:hypothetical protein
MAIDCWLARRESAIATAPNLHKMTSELESRAARTADNKPVWGTAATGAFALRYLVTAWSEKSPTLFLLLPRVCTSQTAMLSAIDV